MIRYYFLKTAVIFFSANLLAAANFVFLPVRENFSDLKERPEKIIEMTAAAREGDYWKSFSPKEAKGIYLTASSALNEKKMDEIISLAGETELNAVVIDIKDGDGVYLGEKMKKLVQRLLAEKIFPIARQTVFFDNDLAEKRPELALKKPNGALWRNARGDAWVDPSSKEVWDYNAKIAKDAVLLGFKEIQFDYVRFPSDGALKSIVFPFWKEEEKSRSETLVSFFEYITNDLRTFKKDVVLSADLFAFTFVVEKGDDLGIGQTVEAALPYFDFISPMVYPSHYSAGNFGFENPAARPYEVVFGTLEKGKRFFSAPNAAVASDAAAGGGESESGTAEIDAAALDVIKWQKVRPWIQDFNLGAVYGKDFIKKQIKAVEEQGLASWLFWNPRNNYQKDKFSD